MRHSLLSFFWTDGLFLPIWFKYQCDPQSRTISNSDRNPDYGSVPRLIIGFLQEQEANPLVHWSQFSPNTSLHARPTFSHGCALWKSETQVPQAHTLSFILSHTICSREAGEQGEEGEGMLNKCYTFFSSKGHPTFSNFSDLKECIFFLLP